MGNKLLFLVGAKHSSAEQTRQAVMRTAIDLGYICEEVSFVNDESMDSAAKEAVCFVSIGGDGTILKSVPYVTKHSIPILGVNTGRVGFLSEVAPEQFADALKNIRAGNFYYDDRMMLCCSINGVSMYKALNDVIVYRHMAGGTAQITTYFNGIDGGSIFCDGIIACTPTGATGYSISAGGPVIAPGLEACIWTPICPHTLSAKPVILSADSTIEFLTHREGDLIIDGQTLAFLNPGDRILVERADCITRFIRFDQKNLFQLIKDKLT